MINLKITINGKQIHSFGKTFKLIILSIFILVFVLFAINSKIYKKNLEKLKYINNEPIIINKFNENKCYSFFDYEDIKIIHLILTRFMISFPNKAYEKNFISNGIRVMNEYLLPSLENQICKNFTWILLVGNGTNIAKIQSLMNFNYSFECKIIQKIKFNDYLKRITKGADVLITSRIDYDDRIYYDAVNDVRKTINIDKPILLHGYNRGVLYNELDGKYYDNYVIIKNNTGVWSVFASLVIFLNSTNSIHTIYDIGDHVYIRKTLIEKHISYGIKNLSYEPAIFDSGSRKFVWVRQNYSRTFIRRKNFYEKHYKAINFNLNKFYGK